MKRRSFISSAPLISGAALGTAAMGNANAAPLDRSSGTVREPARDIPVIASCDVLVVGGGPAGVAAAISSARAGADTILVERYNHLGGLWTGGLVLPLLSTHAIDKNGKFKRVIYGLGGEMADRLNAMGMTVNEVNPSIDPEAGKYLLDVMIRDSGVRMFYHCWMSNVIMEDNAISAVILETKSGRTAVKPKVVVDCTGDGDIIELAGEGFENMRYHIGLVHRLGNVDRIDKKKPGYVDRPIGNKTPIPSVNWVNMHGEDDRDGIDLFTLSELQQKYRISIWEETEKTRKTPGYEEVFLLETAPQIGVRMSRILDGTYMLTIEDSMTFKAFDDVIGISGAWTRMRYKDKWVLSKDRPLWQIPYRSLLPKKTRNLLVAGRCFSFEKALVEDTRIIGTCLVTGHGAGAAAAIAVQSGSSVQGVDIGKVQALLKKQKANIG